MRFSLRKPLSRSKELPKKIPMRMCVACRTMRPKKELVRIVRTPEGEVLADTTGRMNGRGAYVCRDPECLKKAIKIRALERALETRVEESLYETLKEAFDNGGTDETV
ncbi:MAG: YlxR family protein [Clostridia bacterium]|nr:YlxR family protein [Clostridia bacterium]